jgi:zinc transport system ATP-binding protein
MVHGISLTVTNLSVALDGVDILSDISFAVEQGEALAVIGPNGAGKTVLFRALLGLLPHTGTVSWRPGAKIGYAPQRFSVDRSAPITVMEFFLLQSRRFWHPGAEFLGHLEHELTLVGLDRTILRKNVGELSGGQTQRLLIAWAMLQHPGVLLLDEPTAGVDAGFEDTIYSLIHRVQTERGTTLLLISHDLSVVYRYAQKVLCLNKTVVCQGAPLEVLNPEALVVLYGDTGYYRHDPAVRH